MSTYQSKPKIDAAIAWAKDPKSCTGPHGPVLVQEIEALREHVAYLQARLEYVQRGTSRDPDHGDLG